MDIATEKKRKPVARKNDKGETVPEICPKCGSHVGLYFRGEPVWVCSNEKCKKYFGTLPFKASNESTVLDNDELLDEFIATEGVVNTIVIAVKKLIIRLCAAIQRIAMNIKKIKKYFVPIPIRDRIATMTQKCMEHWEDVVNNKNTMALKSKEIPKDLENMKKTLDPQEGEYFTEKDYIQVNTKVVVRDMQAASKKLEHSKLDALTMTNDTQYQVSLMEQIANALLFAYGKYFKFGKSQGNDGNLYDIGQEVEVEFMD